MAEPWPFAVMNSGPDSVKEIARATGGFVFGVSGHNNLVEFLPSWSFAFEYNERTRDTVKLYTQALNIQVNGFYTLSLDLKVPPGRSSKVLLEVVDGIGKPRSDVAWTYSTALVPQTK